MNIADCERTVASPIDTNCALLDQGVDAVYRDWQLSKPALARYQQLNEREVLPFEQTNKSGSESLRVSPRQLA